MGLFGRSGKISKRVFGNENFTNAWDAFKSPLANQFANQSGRARKPRRALVDIVGEAGMVGWCILRGHGVALILFSANVCHT